MNDLQIFDACDFERHAGRMHFSATSRADLDRLPASVYRDQDTASAEGRCWRRVVSRVLTGWIDLGPWTDTLATRCIRRAELLVVVLPSGGGRWTRVPPRIGVPTFPGRGRL